MSSRILTFGHDPSLLRSRELLLRNEGFEVVTATEPKEATRVLTEQHVDLLILCHTVREQERQTILSFAHASDHALKALLLIAAPTGFMQSGQNSSLSTLDGPRTLLAAVHGLTDHGLPSQPSTSV